MTKINWKRKLPSRKLWAAAAGIITGLAMVFGLDENIISTVAGAVVSAASVVAYIIAEGKVDAESVRLSETVKIDSSATTPITIPLNIRVKAKTDEPSKSLYQSWCEGEFSTAVGTCLIAGEYGQKVVKAEGDGKI